MRGGETGPLPGGPGDTPGAAAGAVRRGEARDAEAVAALHAAFIGEGFLATLGPRFLRLLYRRIARVEGSFLLVVEEEGAAVGFLAGSMAVGRLYRAFLLRDGAAAVLAAPFRLGRAVPSVLETLRYGTGARDGTGGWEAEAADDKEAGSAPEGPTPSRAGGAEGELLSVAVDPRWRGRGVGARLVDAFLREVERRGGNSARVVVGAANDTAVAMYRRAGFHPVRRFEFHRGVRSLLMAVALPQGSARPTAP